MTDAPVRDSSLQQARAVADAVLYEGYLLYPYRASSRKNQVRWQFGVVGPQGALEQGIGEESSAHADCLVLPGPVAALTIHVRFLQLQRRTLQRNDSGNFAEVSELLVGADRLIAWDEAVEREIEVADIVIAAGVRRDFAIDVAGSVELEDCRTTDGALVGRIVRTRDRLDATLRITVEEDGAYLRLKLRLDNRAVIKSSAGHGQARAIAVSLIGAHILMQLDGAAFVSTVDPPSEAVEAAERCSQHRWWPVLAGPADETGLLLVSPIILEDHAQLAPQSAGALFDSTEIDEILTLRVMTLTDEEKAEARATDPRAAEIIDRCDAMTPEDLQDLHGILRNPHATAPDVGFDLPGDLIFKTEEPWWDPEADSKVDPSSDTVVIQGVRVGKGSLVVVQPNRRADAHDIFFKGMTAKVAAVLNDVDGGTHVAVTLIDDPAADLHDWYGRYLYFAPDELVPDDVVSKGD